MKEFPGVVARRREHRCILSNEQMSWLRRWYPITENCRLAKAMGISLYKFHELSQEYGLTKSEAGLKAIRRRRDKAAAKTNERNGCYARKRGHPVSEATIAGTRKRWEEYRNGLREHPLEMIKRTDPERYEAIKVIRSQNRRDLIAKEKRRIIYGLERKTNIKVVVMKAYTKSQIARRHNALLRGYLLDEDCSEGQPGRYVIYYDDQTERSEKFEENCIKDGFRFERDE